MKRLSTLLAMCLAVVVSANAVAYKAKTGTYEITITNITKGQTFTPIAATAHSRSLALFDLGMPASAELATIAESGNVQPLVDLLASVPNLSSGAEASAGLLGPGESVTLTINAGRQFPVLSLAAMLIPTNDTFVALDSVRLPRWPGASRVFFARAYDAGSETNDEVCANIPGPACGGAGPSPEDDGEGFVHVASGVHGEGELAASVYDWNGPVARVEVRRIR